MILLFILIFTFIGVKTYIQVQNYQKTSYYRVTKNSFFDVYYNKGKFGEYLTYKQLIPYEDGGNRFLFNLYIPSRDNKTTELDLVMITKKGIIVFESKNFSGWIFGDINSKMWMQTLPNGRGKSSKSQFYNPIFQNKGHINNLRKLLDDNIPIFSIIVFSERCTLKKVPENSKELMVINRYDVAKTIKKIYEFNPDVLEQNQVGQIYTKLYKYTQTDETIKKEHIQNIKNTNRDGIK